MKLTIFSSKREQKYLYDVVSWLYLQQPQKEKKKNLPSFFIETIIIIEEKMMESVTFQHEVIPFLLNHSPQGILQGCLWT